MAKKRAKKKIGVFSYDLFPYRVTHHIKGFTDDGDLQVEGFTMGIQGLNCIVVGDRGKKVEIAIEKARSDYREGQKKLRDDIMEALLVEFPELKKNK